MVSNITANFNYIADSNTVADYNTIARNNATDAMLITLTLTLCNTITDYDCT